MRTAIKELQVSKQQIHQRSQILQSQTIAKPDTLLWPV